MNIPLNIDWQQILLHLFNFMILAGGLYLLLYKPVKKFMDQRTADYQQMQDEAEQKLASARELEASYEEKMKEADAEILRKKTQAAKDAEESADAHLKAAREQAEKVLADAKESARKEQEKILFETQTKIAGLASEAVEKLLSTPAEEVYDQFLDSAERGDAHEA
ncbi:MAG TPA: ATP synthase F0 subunit B [Firmicutes bacterium]|nr:ATP synthase F0 subunit B [Bacillota bacterium]